MSQWQSNHHYTDRDKLYNAPEQCLLSSNIHPICFSTSENTRSLPWNSKMSKNTFSFKKYCLHFVNSVDIIFIMFTKPKIFYIFILPFLQELQEIASRNPSLTVVQLGELMIIMHLSMFSLRCGMAGIHWGLDCQNSHCPREFDRRLWHRDGTLDVSARKSRRNYERCSLISETGPRELAS